MSHTSKNQVFFLSEKCGMNAKKIKITFIKTNKTEKISWTFEELIEWKLQEKMVCHIDNVAFHTQFIEMKTGQDCTQCVFVHFFLHYFSKWNHFFFLIFNFHVFFVFTLIGRFEWFHKGGVAAGDRWNHYV